MQCRKTLLEREDIQGEANNNWKIKDANINFV